MTEVMVPRRAQCCGIGHQGRRRRDGSCGGMSIAPRPGQARHVGQRKQVRADVGKYHVKRQVRGPLVGDSAADNAPDMNRRFTDDKLVVSAGLMR